MKIGIISINLYPKTLNFACPIHSYAFQRFLDNNQIESTIIDYMASYDYGFDFRYPANYYKEKCEKINRKPVRTSDDEAKLQKLSSLYEEYNEIYKERENRYNKFKAFTDKYYKKTDSTYNSDLLEILDLDFDCYICATDVIWKTPLSPRWGLERAFFLASHCMDNKYKIAYAASRNSELLECEYDEFFHYLSDFDAISVREEPLKDLIEQNSDIKVECVLDPVLLLDKEEYELVAKLPQEKGYLLLYYVVKDAEDTIIQALDYARAHNLTIIELSDKPYSSLERMSVADVDYSWSYDVGPDEWLGYFLNAKCIFTNSFHACCFSILFEKDFYVGSRNGYKVQNVLELFKISERQLELDFDLVQNPLKPIDYVSVKNILEKERISSEKFILEAIREAEKVLRVPKDYSLYRKNLTYELMYKCSVPSNVKVLQGMDELISCETIKNDATTLVAPPKITCEGYSCRGWKLKFQIDNMWFWYLKNDSFVCVKEYNSERHGKVRVFRFGENIPYLPFEKISKVVLKPVWKVNKEKS